MNEPFRERHIDRSEVEKHFRQGLQQLDRQRWQAHVNARIASNENAESAAEKLKEAEVELMALEAEYDLWKNSDAG